MTEEVPTETSPASFPAEELHALMVIRRAITPLIMANRLAKDNKRRAIMKELIETERNFVEGLVTLDVCYYKPMDQSISSKKPLCDAETLGQLFGNIDQIREVHQVGILKVMDEQLPHFKTSFPPKDCYLKIGNAFHDLFPRIEQLYRQYLQTNDNSDAIIAKLNKNKSFRDFVGRALFDPRVKCRNIEDFIIAPVQRVAGYKCLFERLIKYFNKGSEEHNIYSVVLKEMLDLGAKMNQEKAQGSEQDKLLEVAETVTKKPPFLVILKPGRRYLAHVRFNFVDPVTCKKGDSGMLYIFTDIVIFAKKKKGGMFKSEKIVFVSAIPIQQISIVAVEDPRYSAVADKICAVRSHTSETNILFKSNKKLGELTRFMKKQKKKIKVLVAKQCEAGKVHMQTILSELADLYEQPQTLPSRAEMLKAI